MISFPAGSRPTVEWYRTVARLYLPSAMGYYATDAERFAWQAGLVFHPGGAVVDVGSGFSPFVLGLQLLGHARVYGGPLRLPHGFSSA